MNPLIDYFLIIICLKTWRKQATSISGNPNSKKPLLATNNISKLILYQIWRWLTVTSAFVISSWHCTRNLSPLLIVPFKRMLLIIKHIIGKCRLVRKLRGTSIRSLSIFVCCCNMPTNWIRRIGTIISCRSRNGRGSGFAVCRNSTTTLTLEF